MASLLFAASFLTYNKIKDKRAAKKEAKCKGYQARYNELEREHSQEQGKHVQALQTDTSQTTEQNVPSRPADLPAGRTSTESGRISTHSRDDPSSWVDDVLREHEKRRDLPHVDATV